MPSAERMIAVRPRRPTRRRAPGKTPSRWTVARVAAPVRAAVSRSHVPRAAGAPRASCAEHRSALAADLDQDRRLSRGLRLLPAGEALSHRRRRERRCSTSTPWSRPRGAAKDEGATRFCMGAAWRGPKDRDLAPVLDMVREVKALGLETCCTLGMLKDGQADGLKAAGLDYYNHNLDTSAGILRRGDHDARLPGPARHAGARPRGGHQRLLRRHRRHGRDARAARRARSRSSPAWIRIRSRCRSITWCRSRARRCTARSAARARSIRSSSCARSRSRASRCRRRWCGCRPAGASWGRRIQALCFLAGANSIFHGDKLLTTDNPDVDADRSLLARLGLTPAA